MRPSVPPALKYLAMALAALLALVLIAAAVIAATFDPNDYKPLLIRLVQEQKQRTLSIPGDIQLRFFPRLAIDLGPVQLSEQGSQAEFASVTRAQVSLALIPLLSRQWVVDRVQIDGLRLRIQRAKDGHTNIDDLVAPTEQGGAEKGGAPLRFDIDSVKLTHAHVVFDDRQLGRMLTLDNLHLTTGRIADRTASKLQSHADISSDQPRLRGRMAFDSGFTFDLKQQQLVLRDIDGTFQGDAFDIKEATLRLTGNADVTPASKRFALERMRFTLQGKHGKDTLDFKLEVPKLAVTDTQVTGGPVRGDAQFRQGARSIDAHFSLPRFSGSPHAFNVESLTLDATLRQPQLELKASVSGPLSGDMDRLSVASPQVKLVVAGKQNGTAVHATITTPFAAQLKTQTLRLSSIAAEAALPYSGRTLALKAAGAAQLNWGQHQAHAQLKGRLDDSAFDASVGLTQFSPAAYRFDIGIDRLDLDRYRQPPAPSTHPPSKAGQGARNAPPADQPLDWAWLQALHAQGRLRIGALKAANIRADNVRADIRIAGGKLDVQPLQAALYGGQLAGGLSVVAAQPARFALRQQWSGIHVGPLLKDALGKDPIEGKGDVQLEVTSSGATMAQIKQALQGSARLALRDGSVRGINIAQAVRKAKAGIAVLKGQPAPQTGVGSAAEKTDFSELNGSFRIVQGVAHNDDLMIKSPLMRVTGAGEIDLGHERIHYLAKATIVSTLQGQGGPELQALKGMTVPVKLTGPFTAMAWQIDVAGMASELARQRIDEKKEEVQSKARKALDEQKDKLQERLKEQFKGLFGR